MASRYIGNGETRFVHALLSARRIAVAFRQSKNRIGYAARRAAFLEVDRLTSW
jgi:hypothetical protein